MWNMYAIVLMSFTRNSRPSEIRCAVVNCRKRIAEGRQKGAKIVKCKDCIQQNEKVTG